MLICNRDSRFHLDILPQSFGDFDPEADPELKKPPDPSESSIWRNFSKHCISIRTKMMLRSKSIDDTTLDPGRDFIDPENNVGRPYDRCIWVQGVAVLYSGRI